MKIKLSILSIIVCFTLLGITSSCILNKKGHPHFLEIYNVKYDDSKNELTITGFIMESAWGFNRFKYNKKNKTLTIIESLNGISKKKKMGDFKIVIVDPDLKNNRKIYLMKRKSDKKLLTF
jgi:hypothetical protein